MPSKGFLDLPQELRDHIYELVAVKCQNTITMLSNHDCFKSEVSAGQPHLARVNKQIRSECLPIFYNNNVFLAEVGAFDDLATAKRWLRTVGDGNLRHLRQLSLCGWTKVVLGHRIESDCRLWIRAAFDLKAGTVEIEGNQKEVDAETHVVKDMNELRETYRVLLEKIGQSGFDVWSLSKLMNNFYDLCHTW